MDSEPVPIRIRQTGLSVDATNPVSHLVYTFECESMCITFASVDRPLMTAFFVFESSILMIVPFSVLYL